MAQAGFTMAITKAVNMQILPCVGMSLWAKALRRIMLAVEKHITPPDILKVAYWFQMIGIHAKGIPAKVIRFQAIGNNALQQCIGVSMGGDRLIAQYRQFDAPIPPATSPCWAYPYPTPIRLFADSLPEIGHGVSNFSWHGPIIPQRAESLKDSRQMPERTDA